MPLLQIREDTRRDVRIGSLADVAARFASVRYWSESGSQDFRFFWGNPSVEYNWPIVSVWNALDN